MALFRPSRPGAALLVSLVLAGLICDAHTPTGGYVENGKLLFDVHAFPLRIAEVAGMPFQGVLKVGYADSLFGRSKGRRHAQRLVVRSPASAGGPKWYWANTQSDACPGGFNTEATIQELWKPAP